MILNEKMNSSDLVDICERTLSLMRAWYPFYLRSIKYQYDQLSFLKKIFKRNPLPESRISSVIKKFNDTKIWAEDQSGEITIKIYTINLLKQWDDYCFNQLSEINLRHLQNENWR